MEAARMLRGEKHVSGENQRVINRGGPRHSRPRAREHGFVSERHDRSLVEILDSRSASHSARSRCAGRWRIGRAASPETEIEEEESMTERLCVLTRETAGGYGNWVRGAVI